MDVTNYKGPLPVAVVLHWKGESLAGPISTTKASFDFILANESLTAFSLTFNVGGSTIKLGRLASKTKRYFSDTLNTFTTAPIVGTELDKLLAAVASKPKGTISLTFSYYKFFDVLLEQMTRTDADLHNLANPNDSKAILDTFTHSNAGGKVRITYKADTQEIKALPCTFVDREVLPGATGKPPSVKLVIDLDFMTGLDAARRAAMRKLVAMDLSKLARYGEPKKYATVPYIKVWYDNVYAYLSNQTKLARGEMFRQAITNRHKLKAADVIAKDLRDDIDLHVITANHWGELRESMKTERHQRLISDLFGTLHQSAYLASPVAFIRRLRREYSLTYAQWAALTLQYGAGHCGEHSLCSYTILADIIAAPGAKILHAVRTGNANIDHAFVVYNLKVDKVILTKTTATNNTKERLDDGRVAPPGWKIRVWDLRKAIASNAPQVGYVMDPYLDATIMKPTAKQLLDALNSPKRKKDHKDTDFLAFSDATPVSHTEDDITGKSEAERRILVKNV
jgi:hypothetical protein